MHNQNETVNPKRLLESSGEQVGWGPNVLWWPAEMRWEAIGGATRLILFWEWGGEGEVPSVSGQMGQHSPSGMMGSAQSDVSSQITSSHMTVPLSQTQIWQGSGFHTSLSLYNCPSNVQPPNSAGGEEGRGGWESGGEFGDIKPERAPN